MARIIIHKGFISQGGRLYKAGEIVDIADAGEAKRVVARSGGDFVFYNGEVSAVVESPTQAQPQGSEENVSDSDTLEATADAAEGELPAIDASADMQPAKADRGKKK